MFWQIKQFFKKFPDVDSWAYRFYGWLYDIGLKKYKAGQKESGLTFPTELNHIHFTARATIMEPGFDDVELAIKKMNIPREEASRTLTEFYRTVVDILDNMKEIKSNENKEEVSVVDPVSNGPFDIRGATLADKRGFCEGISVDPKNLPPLGSREWSSSVFTLPEDRLIIYKLPEDVVWLRDDDLVRQILKEVKEYAGNTPIDYIDIKLDSGLTIGRIHVKTNTFEAVESFDTSETGGDT